MSEMIFPTPPLPDETSRPQDERIERTFGFTLIELMIASAIIAILAIIAIPKFAGLILKSKEAAVKGKLGAFRSALSIYYSDTEGTLLTPAYGVSAGGVNPYDMRAIFPRYIDRIPMLTLPSTSLSTTFTYESDGVANQYSPALWCTWGYGIPPAPLYGPSGHIGYTGARYVIISTTGYAFINHYIPDSTGRPWSTW